LLEGSLTRLCYQDSRSCVYQRVELDLEKAESFKSISIAIQAGATAVGQEEQLFLELNQDLWPAANDKSSKLAKGKYSWPFTFTLPAKVTPADAKGLQIEAPPSFTERASPAYIDYRAVVTVKRGAFKMNQTYVPPGPNS
jgi:hypothetical protein